ncbi:MAG: radical SAM protein, partial [Candidatus Lokiarchaeota archaeon]|nr:radical SAM protein [Candidatus Lokiarchaeota archaeon]
MSFSRKVHHLVMLAAIGTQIVKAKLLMRRIPIVVSIHVTNKCNLRCKYCYANVDGRFDAPKEEFSTADLKRYITEMQRLGTRWIVLLGGEPLLRKDIKEIIRHVKRSGMLCELVTNGTLIETNIQEIEDVDLLCISIDGDMESNDAARGNGSFTRALKGLEVATKHVINTRIHAVFTRYNVNARDLRCLASLAARFKTTFGFSNPITPHGDGREQSNYIVNANELKPFLQLVKRYKLKNMPVYNSIAALNFASSDPPKNLSKRRQTMQRDLVFKHTTCHAGDRFCYVDSEGFVYPCIECGVKAGLNIKEVGFKKAFDYLPAVKCHGCNHIQYF